MDIRPVTSDDLDHRFETPAYRVCFWKGGRAWWYELSSGASVRQAIAWADENVGPDRTYTLYALIDMPFPGPSERQSTIRRVAVRLFGVDPTHNPEHGPARWPSEIYTQPEPAT